MRILVIEATYLAASVLFILGLKSLTRPYTARRGMQQAAVGMLLAIVGTLLHQEILTYSWIVTGLIVGTIIGYPLGMFVPMTAMPQRIAFSHAFGALAATLVGVAEYWHAFHGTATGAPAAGLSSARMAALGFEVLFGALTVTGSLMAFGKLQELLPGRPITFRGQNFFNLSLFAVAVGLFAYLIYDPTNAAVFYTMIGIAFLIGILMVMPIGGADMPVVVSLLNSYAGLAAAATGFAIGNNVLIICGALDGASGFLLSILMSKAMNRSFANVLFGAFGAPVAAGASKLAAGATMKSLSPEDAAVQLAYASKVIVVPGYGMAVAQSQHQVRELAELIEKRGGEVKYAIHPVAGRMPGHMSVLLAEAQVPYESMLTDVEDANAQLATADVALVIGANDTVNPAALDEPGSPIYGMPIIDARKARVVFVVKRGKGAGFAGVENALFYAENTRMLYGDAKAVATQVIAEVKGLDGGGHF
jgi:NAD(P) transhydrogenase subunit beta